MSNVGRWTYWRDDGAPVRCSACGDPGATVAREFGISSHGYALRGVYHEECAAELWGAAWRSVIPRDDTLL